MNDRQELPSPVPYAAVVPTASRSSAVPDTPWPGGGPGPDETVPPAGRIELNPGKVVRALRRRWLLAAVFAIVGAGAAGYLANRFVSSTYTARTTIYVPAERPGAYFGGEGRGDLAGRQLRQSALVRSRHVIQIALQRPGVADLSIVRATPDPVAWLEKELQVDFKSAPDLMAVTLKGGPPEDLIVLLNAVREAYLEDATSRELADKIAERNWLADVINDLEKKLAAARADVSNKAGEMDAPDPATVRLRFQSGLTQLANLRALRFQLEIQASDLEKARDDLVASPPDPAAPVQIAPAEMKAATQLVLNADDEALALRATVGRLRAEIAEYKRLLPPGKTTKPYDNKLAELKDATDALAARELVARAEAARVLEAESRRGSESRAAENRNRVAELKAQASRVRGQARSVSAEIEKVDAAALKEAKGIAELDRLAARVNDLEDRHKATLVRRDLLDSELALASPHQAKTHEEAAVTQVPNPAKKTGMIVGAVAAGLLAGLLGIAYLDLRSGRIDSPEGVDRGLQTGVVGCIPRVRPDSLARLTRPTNGDPPGTDEGILCDAADACRTLLLSAMAGDGCKVIMVTSPMAGEGKTSLASQLALSLGRGGYRTLLIDADVRHPGIHAAFGRSQGPGLTDVLRKTHPVQSVVRKTPMPNLGVIPAGQCHPQEAVALFQLRLGSMIRKCKPHFEVILIDTPPLLGLPDAMIVGRHVDGTILSLMNEISTLPAAQAACGHLRTLNIPVLGAVLNAARTRAPLGYY